MLTSNSDTHKNDGMPTMGGQRKRQTAFFKAVERCLLRQQGVTWKPSLGDKGSVSPAGMGKIALSARASYGKQNWEGPWSTQGLAEGVSVTGAWISPQFREKTGGRPKMRLQSASLPPG